MPAVYRGRSASGARWHGGPQVGRGTCCTVCRALACAQTHVEVHSRHPAERAVSPWSPLPRSNVTISNNTAGQFGGGLSFGALGDDSYCGITIANDSVSGRLIACAAGSAATGCYWCLPCRSVVLQSISGNTATRGGSQMHTTCSADIIVSDTVVQMLADGQSQVGGVPYDHCGAELALPSSSAISDTAP